MGEKGKTKAVEQEDDYGEKARKEQVQVGPGEDQSQRAEG